ncbi:metallophosphoesterase family protein [Aspergillus ruber CBS 135680]|uniref:Metallo-dependent phosphatase n=1 Tax=Aspergillus ruber (strain CBS 135680) TaxID=1388766 RepID=A0A017SP95_ASPRC|nr:Metallo-dependent phosphatase [Aspergillus ruber CBS 135680]EYE98606.1 Metallo-dependent phosphatase [Aspergillus ruber CBS 135680]
MIHNNSQALRFAADGTFKISVFSDLHYGESQASVGPENDARTGNVMNTILSIEKPQLVVLNGDLVTGDATSRSNSSAYVDRVLTPLVENNVSWASTYGNHDSATNLCADDVFRRERFHQNCFTQSMVSDPAAGLTNYFLPVFPHNSTAAEVPEVILWFFDTRGGSVCSESEDESDRMPDWVHQSVTKWFIKSHSQLMAEYGKAVPSLAFFHIPTYALRAFQETGISNYTEPGINDEIPVKQQGYFWDDDDYMGQDAPFMDALLRTEEMVATFSGHDHGNDWCFNWNGKLPNMDLEGNGLKMCYGRRTGYGGYGDWARGGRQIVLRQNVSETPIETWIRLEDKTAGARVTLNSTYGQDQYYKCLRVGAQYFYNEIYLC